MHKSGLTLADYRALCGIERASKEIVGQMEALRKHISERDVYGEELRFVFAGRQAEDILRLARGAYRRYKAKKQERED